MKKLFFAALLLVGCTQNKLTVFTEYLSIESLPSYHIGTPDPRLYNPDVGERLHIQWSLPPQEYTGSLKLKLSLHFGDRTEKVHWADLSSPSGTYIYTLINQDYWDKKGIFTYKVELFQDDSGECGKCAIQTWTHMLYAERIRIQDDGDEEDQE